MSPIDFAHIQVPFPFCSDLQLSLPFPFALISISTIFTLV